MTKNIFIATAEPYSGKSIVALGVVNMLLGKGQKVAYFKPIVNDEMKNKKDGHIETMLNYFGLQMNYDETYAYTRQQAMSQMENESRGELIETIIRKVKKLEDEYDFTVIEG